MNELYALINHKKLQMTIDDFNLLQHKMELSQKLIIGNYIFIAKVKSTQWTHSYKTINNVTRQYHFIKIYDLTKIVEDQIPLQAHRIRSRVKKQMLMQPQHIVKCHELLENQDFIMVVQEYCNEGLQDQIIDKKIYPISKSTEWLKQTIYGLAQLYTQNIYLENINPKKILIKDGSCKMADFNNLQRRLTMTEERLVKRHIHELGIIFTRLIFGLKKIGQHEIAFIMGQLNTVQILFGVQLTEQLKEFLIYTLNTDQKQTITWEKMIKLRIFYDDSKSLSNKKFLALSQLVPQSKYKSRPQHIKIYPLTQYQYKLQWDKLQYIKFLKTQLILNKIVCQIDDKNAYNIHDRSVLEILYLLNVRCMNNIRDILIKKDKMQGSIFLKEFGKQVQEINKQVSKRFKKYSGMLTSKENQKLQIGKDWLNMAKSIVTLNIGAKSRRDKFLTGIESFQQHVYDYTKMEQIEFSVESINQFLQKLKSQEIQKGNIYFYLIKYKQISAIKFKDLGCLTFEQYVDKIINIQVQKK